MADGDTDADNTKGTDSNTGNDLKEEEDEDSRYAEALDRLSERVDFFSLDYPLDRMPTYRDHSYQCFMQRGASHSLPLKQWNIDTQRSKQAGRPSSA